MSTITTKQLRENMSQVIDDLRKGKSVQLSYRHKIIGVLQPIQAKPIAQRQGSAPAVKQFLNSADFGFIPTKLQNSSRSFKQEIADLRKQDLVEE